MSWEDKELEELTLYVKRGVSPKYVLENGIPIVNQRCIRENTINFDTARLSSKDKKITEVKFLQVGDTVINSTGVGTLGRTAFVKKLDQPSSADTHVTIVRPDKTKVNPKFLSLYLNSQEDIIENMGRGATGQTELSAKDLNELKVFHPKSLQTQKRIADILSAYDDLIENNLKRIKLLEQAAQNIYKEWFVNMRFPGHENTAINEETGLPEGWEKVSFSSIVSINPKTRVKKGLIAPFVPMKSISEFSMVIGPIEKRPVSGGVKFKNGDTLFARITPCLENGKTGFVQFMENEDEIAVGSTEYIVFRETVQAGRYFIYCTSREPYFRENAIKSMSGSDGRQRVKVECFDKYSLNLASSSIRSLFEDSSKPIFKAIQIMVNQNDKLKAARDILLPRLMNRTIEV